MLFEVEISRNFVHFQNFRKNMKFREENLFESQKCFRHNADIEIHYLINFCGFSAHIDVKRAQSMLVEIHLWDIVGFPHFVSCCHKCVPFVFVFIIPVLDAMVTPLAIHNKSTAIERVWDP